MEDDMKKQLILLLALTLIESLDKKMLRDLYSLLLTHLVTI